MNAAPSGRALVTGAGRGLGLEFVRQLLGRGHRVVATVRRPERAADLKALAAAHPDRLWLLPLDVTDSVSVAALPAAISAHLPALDLLINNAGILVSGERFGKLSADDLQTAFGTNAVAPMLLTQALAPLLQRGNNALVLNISSILGSIEKTEGFYTPSYAVSKAALNMVGKLLSHALAGSGVRVVNLHPGWVRTSMGGAGATLDMDEAVQSILDTVQKLPANATGVYLDRHGKSLPW